jgi:hypothetical protein
MRIGAVSMNSTVNRAQTAIKKISAISKPRTFAVDEVSDNLANAVRVESEGSSNNASKNRLDTLGSEVDVWV